MQADEAKVKMAAKLYECRDAAKVIMGAKYHEEIACFSRLIQAQAKRDGCSELAAASDLAGKAGGFGAIYMLAAYVELVEQSEAPNDQAKGPGGSSPGPA